MKLPLWIIYQDELPNSDGAGGGGGAADAVDLNVDIAAASEEIGAGLGLGEPEDKGAAADIEDGSAPSPPAKKDAAAPAAAKAAAEKAGKVAAARAQLAASKQDLTGKTDDEILELAAPKSATAPKSWKKEMHEHFGKLDPTVQAYVAQREAEVEEGFRAYAEKTKYGEAMQTALQPYEALLTAQGVKDHTFALKTLMNAHYVLSTEQPEGRARFMAGLLKNYNVDLAALTAAHAAQAQDQPEESVAVRELRLRTERLENDRRTELQSRVDAVKAESKAEVEAFASDPAHPYFNEVSREVALLLQDPNVSLLQAYESAIWANPVTRAKEQARLSKEAEAKAREEAEKTAKAAEKARGTKFSGEPEGRESPDILGTMEDTMRSTLKDIQART